MSRYTPTTASDRKSMLEVIGASTVDELFADIPDGVRFKKELAIPEGIAEQDVLAHLSELAAKNTHADAEITFVGAGMYDHYVPACVDTIISRSEFQTSYTPYQPELSQGNLQAIFEFQTAICELTGLPVANASLYDGPTAAPEAAYMAKAYTKRTKLVLSRGTSPQIREVLATYAKGFGMDIVEVGLADGVTDLDALKAVVDDDTAAVFVQQPNFVGAIEDLAQIGETAKSSGALFVCAADPLTLGVLAPPGEFGADIVFGEGQSLGNNLSFGGPSFGFFAVDERLIRKMPGRIAGETTDVDGRRGFVLTLQTREQHIRREKATSNICTNQALNALAGTVYLGWLGKQGIVDLGELMLQRTAYARKQISAVGGITLLHDAPVVREFAIGVDAPVDEVLRFCHGKGVAAGYKLDSEYGEGILVAITEKRSKADIDRLASVLEQAIAECKDSSREAVGV